MIIKDKNKLKQKCSPTTIKDGEEIVSMTELPQELQDKYIKTIKDI